MNTDRRSGYSQNYAQEYSSGSRPAVGAHAGNESAMSRPSREMLAGNQYNAQAQSPALNDEFQPENGWNVYSDFNNAGPRYSTMKTTTDG